MAHNGRLPSGNLTSKQGFAKFRRHEFWKAIGLEAISLLWSTDPEQPKPVYSSSLKTALARSTIHIIPMSVSVMLIALNFGHLLIGKEYTGFILSQPINIALLQLAAKLHEITIVASLTAVVLHFVRRELLFGPGVPLGAVGGAFLFSSLSYLWSPELVGSLRSEAPAIAKAKLYTVILVCMFLAALVGPSSAILMIPREQNWDAGGAKFWFRGNYTDVYPVNLPRKSPLQMTLCMQQNATDYAFCPSGGFAGLRNQLQKEVINITEAVFCDPGCYNSPFDLKVSNSFMGLDTMIIRWSHRGNDCQSGAVAGRISDAIRLETMWSDWNAEAGKLKFDVTRPSISEYRHRKSGFAESETNLPAVKATCTLSALNLTKFEREIQFPILVQDDCLHETASMTVTELNSEPSARLRTSWIRLPAYFGPTSTGMIFEGPWDVISETRLVVGCSILAGWTNGTVTDLQGENVFSGATKYAAPWNRSYDGKVKSSGDPSWQKIVIGEQWLSMLAPSVDRSNNVSTTTLDMILESSGITKNLINEHDSQEAVWNSMTGNARVRSVTLEAILSVVIADGLSREGSETLFEAKLEQDWREWKLRDVDHDTDFAFSLFNNNDPYLKPQITPVISVQGSITVIGLAYKANETSDFLATGVLCAHLLLAFLHIAYLLWLQESSGSWDSLTELIALAHNSKPSKTALLNTGAGIKELGIFRKMAVIRAVESSRDAASQSARLALIFKEERNNSSELQTLLGNDSRLSSNTANSTISQAVIGTSTAASLIETESTEIVKRDESYM